LVIYAYQWSGETYYDDYLSFLQQKVDSDDEIHLLSKPETEMKQELKESVLDYCAKLQKELPKVIENLFGIHPETEEGSMAELFEGLNNLITSASLFQLDSLLEDRHEAVVELSKAYESKDYVELTDLLKYDWLPWITQFEKQLKQLYVGM
ncbi:MAG TPA: hypothetical protein VFK37_04255, partial [Bacillales bacterium]|nr:hypothetical protein [Bacillales bacterium]